MPDGVCHAGGSGPLQFGVIFIVASQFRDFHSYKLNRNGLHKASWPFPETSSFLSYWEIEEIKENSAKKLNEGNQNKEVINLLFLP